MSRLSEDQLEQINDDRDNEVLAGWQMEVGPHKCHYADCGSWHAGTICLGINEETSDRLQFVIAELSFSSSDMVSLMLNQAQLVQLISDLQAVLLHLRAEALSHQG